MNRLLTAVPALAVLAGGIAGALVVAPAAQAQDDLVCVGWNPTVPHQATEPHQTVASTGKCNAWHYSGFVPTFPTMPEDPVPPWRPGFDPDEKVPPTCKEVDEQIAALQRELADLRVQAALGEIVVGHDQAVKDGASADVATKRAATLAASAAVDDAKAAYERAGLVDEYFDRPAPHGQTVSVPIYPDRSHVKRGTPAGDALAAAMDDYTDAAGTQHGAETAAREADAQYATDRAALDATYAATARAQQQLEVARKTRKGCTN